MLHRDASVKIPKPPDSKVKQPDFCYLYTLRGWGRIVGREERVEEIDFFPFFFLFILAVVVTVVVFVIIFGSRT